MKIAKAYSLLFVCLVSTLTGYGQTRATRLTRPETDGAYRTSAAEMMTSRMIRFTGTVWDDSYMSINSTVPITFTIYSDAGGQLPIFSETQNVPVSNSTFTVLLGATTNGLPVEVFAAEEARYIEASASGMHTEPREKLLAVPYAMKAQDAETLSGHFASEFVTGAQLNAAIDAALATNTSVTTFQSSSDVLGIEAGGTGSNVQNFVDLTSNQNIGGNKMFEDGLTILSNGPSKPLHVGPLNSPIFEIDATGMVTANVKTGTAISGLQNSTEAGQGIGVYGYAASEQGVGVYGWSNSDLGRNGAGVYGQASGTEATGVWGWSASASGPTRGVAGEVYSSNGVAGWFDNHAAGKIARFSADGTEVASVEGDGTITTTGIKLKSASGNTCARLVLNEDGTLAVSPVSCQ